MNRLIMRNKKIRAFCCFGMAAMLFFLAIPASLGKAASGSLGETASSGLVGMASDGLTGMALGSLVVAEAKEREGSPDIPYGQDVKGYDPKEDGYYGMLPIYYEVPGSEIGEDASKSMAKNCLPVLVYGQLVYAPARLLPEVTGLSLKTGTSGLCLSCWERKLYLSPGSDEAYFTIGEPNLYGRYYTNMKFCLRGPVLDYEGEDWVPLTEICLLFDLKPHLLEIDGQEFFSFFQVKEDVVDVLARLFSDSASYICQYSGGDLEKVYASSGFLQVYSGLFEGDTDSWAMFLKSCFFLDEWAMEGWERAMTEDMVLAILETGADETIQLMGQCLKLASDWLSFGTTAGESMTDITFKLAVDKVSDLGTSLILAHQENYINAAWYEKMYDMYFSKAAFSMKMWEVSDSFQRFGKGLDLATIGIGNLVGVVSYWEAFRSRDKLAASALEKVMSQKEDFLHLGENIQSQIEKSLKDLEDNSVTYSLYHYMKDNFPSWILDGVSSKCPPLALYRLAMHLVPFVQDVLSATKSFQVSMYAIPFQLDVRNVFLTQLESYHACFSTPEQVKESVELAYAFLKTCYTARNLAISALSTNGTDQSASISACTRILEELAVLSAAYREDSSQVYAFCLPDAIRDIHQSDDTALTHALKPMYIYAEGEVKNHADNDAPVEDAKCEITADGELLGTFEGTDGGSYAVYVPTEKADRLLPVDADFSKNVEFYFTSPTVPGEDTIQIACGPKEEICPMEIAYLNAMQQVIVTVSAEEMIRSDYTSSIISPIVTIPGKEDVADAITNNAIFKNMVETAISSRDAYFEGNYDSPLYDDITMFFDLTLQDAYCAGNALSMQFMEYLYLGGAHPNSWRYSFTFDLETGKELTLSDLLNPDNPNAREELIALFTQALRENIIEPTDPERNIRRVFDGEYGYNLWHFSKDGLQITYSPYVIASYAAGYIIAIVPYEKLGGILRAEYLPPKGEKQEAKGSFIAQTQQGGGIALRPDGTLCDVFIGNGYTNSYYFYRKDILYYSNVMGSEDSFLLPETETHYFIAEYSTKEKEEKKRTSHAVGITAADGLATIEPVVLTD